MTKHADGNILPGKPVFILFTVLKDKKKTALSVFIMSSTM